MADIFNTTPAPWSFTAVVPASLYAPTINLPLTRPVGMIVPKSTRGAKYWERATRGMDFTSEDKIDFTVYNHILRKGLMGNKLSGKAHRIRLAPKPQGNAGEFPPVAAVRPFRTVPKENLVCNLPSSSDIGLTSLGCFDPS